MACGRLRFDAVRDGATQPDVLVSVDGAIADGVDATGFDARTDSGPRTRDAQAFDAFNTTCTPGTCLRVFVTAEASAPPMNGSEGAQSICQAAADAQRLGGLWRAWLSDGEGNPSGRFTRGTVPYRLLDGSLVAAGWSDLTDGTIAHAISVTESGGSITTGATQVWTGTDADGTAAMQNCSNWSNRSSESIGLVGSSRATDRTWSSNGSQQCSRTDLHFYCFEQ